MRNQQEAVARYVEEQLSPYYEIIATAAAIGVRRLDQEVIRGQLGGQISQRGVSVMGGDLIRRELELRLDVATKVDDKSWTVFGMPGGVVLRTKKDTGEGKPWVVGSSQMMLPGLDLEFTLQPDVTLAWSMNAMTGREGSLGLHMYDGASNQFWSTDLLPVVNETIVAGALGIIPAILPYAPLAEGDAQPARFRRINDDAHGTVEEGES